MLKEITTIDIAVDLESKKNSNLKNNLVTTQNNAYALTKNKLTSQKGESIAEALIALLIVALGIVLLATMISASTRIVKKSNERLEAMYTVTNQLEQQNGTPTQKNITIDLDGDKNNIQVNQYNVQDNVQDSVYNFNLYSYELK